MRWMNRRTSSTSCECYTDVGRKKVRFVHVGDDVLLWYLLVREIDICLYPEEPELSPVHVNQRMSSSLFQNMVIVAV